MILFTLFFGCAKQPNITLDETNYNEVLQSYKKNCTTKKAQLLYGDLCRNCDGIEDAKSFFQNNFELVHVKAKKKGLLTGYYEPLLYGSLVKTQKYTYPLYEKPKDLVDVDLSSLYPKLKHYRLRGRLVDGKVVPYFTRKVIKERGIDAHVLCYCNSQIDRFFLEVQGSGRVQLDDNTTLFVGYSDQNGYKYRSIGKYLIEKGAIKRRDISLQTIASWLKRHPKKRDEVLNFNQSFVFFRKKQHSATGALGVVLTPYRSLAVDRKYIPLGSMVYLKTFINGKVFHKIVFAQDTGSAIKGEQRADIFLGSSYHAKEIAGKLQAPLDIWIMRPKEKRVDE